MDFKFRIYKSTRLKGSQEKKQQYKTRKLMLFLSCGVAGFWPHAYFEHILNPEAEDPVQSTTNSNHRRSLSGGPVAMEMGNVNQELGSMEEGRRAR